jgi:hypothetical protein
MNTEDYGMFTAEGNERVAALVDAARLKTSTEDEGTVRAWITAETGRIASDAGTYPLLPDLADEPGDTTTGHGEVRDTSVREAIGVELDPAWKTAYGCSYFIAGAILAGLHREIQELQHRGEGRQA